MHELRPHLVEPQFLERIRQQQQSGYQLAYLERDRQIEAVAGFRISQNLAWGKFLYVDDLVTRSQLHAQGCGGALFDWLVEYARTHTCEQLHLDSGVQRFVAHRFYIKKRMYISSHHFSMHLVD
jgi:GNAT superfamily N-acetyltransferase